MVFMLMSGPPDHSENHATLAYQRYIDGIESQLIQVLNPVMVLSINHADKYLDDSNTCRNLNTMMHFVTFSQSTLYTYMSIRDCHMIPSCSQHTKIEIVS